MKNKPNIAIIGTGAVGGYYGALLQQAGASVHFLVRAHAEQIHQQGLIIESPNGDLHLNAPMVYDNAADMPRCDIVIVALKTTANSALASILPSVLAPDGWVITLQNGLGSDELISTLLGHERVLGGLCFLCAHKVAPGHIRHLDYGLITLGAYRHDRTPAGITEPLTRVGALLDEANISIRLMEDLSLARWKKLVWNIPFNGLSVVENVLTNKLVKEPKTRQRSLALMNEVRAASAACSRPIPEAFAIKMMADTEKMKPYAPSMKLDFDHQRPMEVESIYGEPLRRAKAAGVEMPETERLYQQLCALNQRNIQS